jgi:hypothetical protein
MANVCRPLNRRFEAPSTAIHSAARSWLWGTARISYPSNRICKKASASRKAILSSFTCRNESEDPGPKAGPASPPDTPK